MKIVQTLFTKWMGFRLDESIKYGNFHPQIKHFSKLKTKILRKIRTLQSLTLIGTRHQRHPENSTWNFKLKTQANLHGNLPNLNLNMSFFFLGIYHHRLSIGFGHGLNSIFGPFAWLFHTFYVQVVINRTVIRFLAR